nr:hypothetical protein [Tanacetum cinerariifolium]
VVEVQNCSWDDVRVLRNVKPNLQEQLKLPIICKSAKNRSKVEFGVAIILGHNKNEVKEAQAKLKHAFIKTAKSFVTDGGCVDLKWKIQIEDYADRRNTSVGLFGKLQHVMHWEKERGLSKLPKEVLISSDTKILGQRNGNKKEDIVMEKHATTETKIGCHIDGVAVVFK